MLATFNLQQWIEEHRHLLKPPVGNAQIWTDQEFIVMVVGQAQLPEETTTSISSGEFFYQVEGDIVLKVVEDGRHRDIPIRQGDIFLLPANVPHSPQRPANTVGLVLERLSAARSGRNTFAGTARGCGSMLHDTHFVVTDIIGAIASRFSNASGALQATSIRHLPEVRDRDGATETGFMKIDLHTHILPRDWPDLVQRYGYGPWPRMNPPPGRLCPNHDRRAAFPRGRGELLGCRSAPRRLPEASGGRPGSVHRGGHVPATGPAPGHAGSFALSQRSHGRHHPTLPAAFRGPGDAAHAGARPGRRGASTLRSRTPDFPGP